MGIADRAQRQPGAGAVEEPAHQSQQQEGAIDQGVLTEQDRADHGQIAQDRQIELRQGRHGIAHEALADEGAEAGAEDRERQTCGHLVRQQQQDQDAEEERHADAGRRGRGDAEHGAAGA